MTPSDAPTCLWCGEPVLPGEKSESTHVLGVGPAVRHYECAARAAIGSVGHQLGLCACNGGPGTLDDPSGVSKRFAATAALSTAAALHAAHEKSEAAFNEARAYLREMALACEAQDVEAVARLRSFMVGPRGSA